MGEQPGVSWLWSEIRHRTAGPCARALLAATLLAAIMLPYWWLAVEWAARVIPDPDTRFTFVTTTFLLLLIIADSTFLIRYYQLVQKRELLAMTDELRGSEEALRVANRKLNLLSGITRHDIKNQLMALKTYLELSSDSVETRETLAGYVMREKEIADNIERQINFTKDYENMGVNAPVWQDVRKLTHGAVQELPMKAVRLEIGFDGLQIFADPLLFKVFYNLIDNALRYGGEQMTLLRLDAEEKNGTLSLIFTDDGTGIRPDQKEQLFSKGHGTHTGFGLFLTREILAITGIVISETGMAGAGARFEMIVPSGRYRFAKG
jgi:signal transduction histidine kinase